MKLPSNPESTYVEISENGEETEKLRWDLIRNALTATKIKNTRELVAAIKIYNTKRTEQWSFSSLHELFEDTFSNEDVNLFINNVIPKIIELALKLPALIQCPIPLLKKKMNHSISLSQEQAACLLANAFLCTFPRRNMGRKHTDYPEINFNGLFSSNGDKIIEKIRCLLHYFKRVCCDEMPNGVLTFQRRFIEKERFPDWKDSNAKFSSIKLSTSLNTNIEEVAGALQVDFANRYLGGGVLGWGCVQEEIRFVINPEMIVGMLFCESMNSMEAIVMTGCEQFSRYTGYAQTFQWHGNFVDETPRDVFRRRMTYVVAIDALSFHKPHLQFEDFALTRELNKAFAGFFHDPRDGTLPIPVVSGNWGCGVFKGFKQLKALLQLMACCVNRRNLFYCTFHDSGLEIEILEMFDFLSDHNISVGELRNTLTLIKEKKMANQPNELYSFIYKQIKFREEAVVRLREWAMNDTDPDEISDDEDDEECMSSNIESPENPPTKRQKTESEASNSQNTTLEHLSLKLSETSEKIKILPDTVEGSRKSFDRYESADDKDSFSRKAEKSEELNDKNETDNDSDSTKADVAATEVLDETCKHSSLTTTITPTQPKITDFFKPKQ